MGLISQVTAEIKLDERGPKGPDRGGNFSGGNSLLHAANIILNYGSSYGGDFIMDPATAKFNDPKAKVIGQEVRVQIGKALKERAKKKTLTYPIKYGRKPSGIWQEREVADLMIMYQYAIKGGAWININENMLKDIRKIEPEFPEKINGINKLYETIGQYPKVIEMLKETFFLLMTKEAE
jgi:hypothetical protein